MELYDEAAERHVLGAMMLGGTSTVIEVGGVIDETDLWRGAHRTVWDAIVGQVEDRAPCDLPAVTDRLVAQGDQDASTLAVDAVTETPSAASAVYYARIVHDLSRRRRIVDTSRRAAAQAEDRAVDVEQVVSETVESLARSRRGTAIWSRDALVEAALEQVGRPEKLGMPSPWLGLAEAWRIVPGWVHVVTGYPSAGKSALVDAMVVELIGEGVKTAMWSPEAAPVGRHALRMAGILSSTPPHELAEADAVVQLERVADSVTWIDHDEARSLPAVLAQASVVRQQSGLDLVVIDPFTDLEKWDGEGAGEAWDRMLDRQLSRLRSWARSNAVPVIVVAHPKMRDRNADGSYPVAGISDLHGGALWRNRLDSCVSVWRDEQHADPAQRALVQVHVQKIRENGPGGIMGYRGDLRRTASGAYVATQP